MSIHPADAEYLYSDFVPQAEIQFPISEMKTRFELSDGCDDLDEFIGAAFVIDKSLVFTIKHYRGRPDGVFTIYFKPIHDVRMITEHVKRIMFSLELPPHSLRWDRSQSPDL